MDLVATLRPRRFARPTVVIVGSLAVVTITVGWLESRGLQDASPVYLLAVVLTAVVAGAGPAVVAAVASFVSYDFLFVAPHYTLTVEDPQEWLNLILLLVVGIVVGRLAGRERDRAEAAVTREREANALFRTSFALATAPSALEALPGIVKEMATAVRGRRVWIEVAERVVADTGLGPTPVGSVLNVLARRPGERPAEWVRVHVPSGPAAGAAATEGQCFRVAISAGERTLGNLWTERSRVDGAPTPGETRVLAAAADQVGRVLERDRLAGVAAAAEVARRSDVLKSALLDSVSHDLRTPLASIRASAGTLMDPAIAWSDDERRAIAGAIDTEADRLNRLVSNLLDMSRIEAGELRPSTSAFVLFDLVEAALGRSTVGRRSTPVIVEIPDDLPPVEVDDVLFDQVLANVLDNAGRYAGSDAQIRIHATAAGQRVALTIEDGGPGVPPDALPRLFDKFYRAPRALEGSRRGTGAGLAVVRGLIAAMGGSATARPSGLGGLAIDLTVPVAARADRRTDPASAARP
jgi:two-component system sensor histidine kinase KdpD